MDEENQNKIFWQMAVKLVCVLCHVYDAQMMKLLASNVQR